MVRDPGRLDVLDGTPLGGGDEALSRSEELLYSCYVDGRNVPGARTNPLRFQMHDRDASVTVCEDHNRYPFIMPELPLPQDPGGQMIVLKHELQNRGMSQEAAEEHLKRGVLVKDLGIVSFSIKGDLPRRRIVKPFFRKRCPICHENGSGPYVRKAGWKGKDGRKGFAYFAHYAGSEGKLTRIKWCYVGEAHAPVR